MANGAGIGPAFAASCIARPISNKPVSGEKAGKNLGSKRRCNQGHDLALVNLSYGHMLGLVAVEGHWYHGNPEFLFEWFTVQNRTRQLAEIREHQAHDVIAPEIAVKLCSERN